MQIAPVGLVTAVTPIARVLERHHMCIHAPTPPKRSVTGVCVSVLYLLAECTSNAGFMHTACPVSCNACPDGDEDPKCKRSNHTAAVAEGGIGGMFRRLLERYPHYSPNAISTDPWVVVLDSFLSDEEAERFKDLCADHFERSMAGDQLSPVRTSDQCWGSRPEFQNDPMVRDVTERIASLTETPSSNAEYFQVVRYEVGQCASSAARVTVMALAACICLSV